eukprot:CAMPEP_0201492938 /NCGR_PEP_ID=MMETSP0151_2-20130828/35421_1 /ASSEMBLY_ACC=CAM_ASM_000257 /TAXON_ID=200890 /ORGANISM="Paramoeba atlantica, Strain 621/1 / CCAP 1560/9" /LENGTH=324 /DNA_ID=CAMNT_0047880035 /DNA_START=103 /DNA_END=1077 /DNA_ORIENTATION=+
MQHSGPMEGTQVINYQMENPEISSGQKRPANTPLEDQPAGKKSKPSASDEDIQVTQPGYPNTGHYTDGTLMQSPSSVIVGNRDQNPPNTLPTTPVYLRKSDSSESNFEYEVTSSGRKTGRMAGAKGYSLQEIQALFQFIHEKPPVDNSDWVSLAMKYNSWAKENKKSPRTGRGLKDKLRKVALVSKEDKLKPVTSLTPIQQEARECIKLINMATSLLMVDEKDEEGRSLQEMGGAMGGAMGGGIGGGIGGGMGDLRERGNEVYHFQPSQLSNLADLLRGILNDTRQTAQRLSNIEQMMENLKGTGDCGLDEIATHSRSDDKEPM